jgi:hypothetical protein
MAIGGFNNQGGNLTLAQFKQYVARGEIHYYIAGTMGAGGGFGGGAALGGGAPQTGSGARPGGPPSRSGTAHTFPGGTGAPGGLGGTGGPGGQGGSSSSAITSWVKAHYKSVTIGGQTVYDLTQARA